MGKNRLTGPIPDHFGTLSKLAVLDLSYNGLTGTIPSSLKNLEKLYMIQFQHNQLRTPEVGSEPNFLNGIMRRVGSDLQIIDVSYNLFTGDLGEAVFSGNANEIGTANKLSVLNVGSNCFSGELPDNICDAVNMEMLIMSQMTGGKSCLNNYWSNTPFSRYFTGFGYSQYLKGLMPQCVLQFKNITGVYMSGLGVTGYLPQRISPSLRFLDLSRNKLVGAIPAAAMSPSLKLLDLSYNLLSGDLDAAKAIQYVPPYKVSLEVNYLSGYVPNSYQKLSDINILSGNLFACSNAQPLPGADPEVDKYVCASNVFDKTSFLVVISLAIVLVSAAFCYQQLRNSASSYHSYISSIWTEICVWYEMSLSEKEIQQRGGKASRLLNDVREIDGNLDKCASLLRYLRLISRMRVLVFYIGCSIALVFVTFYCALRAPKNRTLADTYLWVTTAGYLSGPLASFLCVGLYLTVIATVRDMLVFEDVAKRRQQQVLENEIEEAKYNLEKLKLESLTSNRDSHSPLENEGSPASNSSSPESLMPSTPSPSHESLTPSPTSMAQLSPDSESPASQQSGSSSDSALASSPRSDVSDLRDSESPRSRSLRRGNIIVQRKKASLWSRIFWDNMHPAFRMAFLCFLCIFIFVVINATFVTIYISSDTYIQHVAELFLSVIYAFYDTFTDFVFSHNYFLLGTTHDRNEAFAKRIWGSSMVPLLFTKLVNMVFVPFAMTACLDPSCFFGYFVASKPIEVEYKSWSCESQLFDTTTNLCLAVTKKTFTESATMPFTYNFQCSASLLRTFVPIYIGDFIIKLGLALTKCGFLIWYGVSGEVPMAETTDPLDKIFQNTPFMGKDGAATNPEHAVVKETRMIKTKYSNESFEIFKGAADTSAEPRLPVFAGHPPEKQVSWEVEEPTVADTEEFRDEFSDITLRPTFVFTEPAADAAGDGTAIKEEKDAKEAVLVPEKGRVARFSKLMWRFVFNSGKLLRSFHHRKSKFLANPTKLKIIHVKALDNISSYISNLILITCIGMLAPLLAALFMVVTVIDIFADQLVLGRFFVLQASVFVLASKRSDNKDKPLSDLEGGTETSEASNPGRVIVKQDKTAAACITEDMLADINQPWGAIHCLDLVETECEFIDTNSLSSCKTILVAFSSVICSVFINDMYNGKKMTEPTLVAPSIMLLFIPCIELIIMLIKCYNPHFFLDTKKVSVREQAEFKLLARDMSRTRALKAKSTRSNLVVSRRLTAQTKINSLARFMPFRGRNSSSPEEREASQSNRSMKACPSERAIKDLDAGINPILSLSYEEDQAHAVSHTDTHDIDAVVSTLSSPDTLIGVGEGAVAGSPSMEVANHTSLEKGVRKMSISKDMHIIPAPETRGTSPALPSTPEMSEVAEKSASRAPAPESESEPVPATREAPSAAAKPEPKTPPPKKRMSVLKKIRKSIFGSSAASMPDAAAETTASPLPAAAAAATALELAAPGPAVAKTPEHHASVSAADAAPIKKSPAKPVHDDASKMYDAL